MARIGGSGLERVYYIIFEKDGKVFEEKVGRQFSDDMTPARAARIIAQRIEVKQQSRKEIREASAVVKWTIDLLWQEYNAGWRTDGGRYENHLKAPFGGKEPRNISQLDIHRLRLTLTKTLKPQTVKHVLILLHQTIPLNDAARETLENHPKFDSPFVFPGRRGMQRTSPPHRINTKLRSYR